MVLVQVVAEVMVAIIMMLEMTIIPALLGN